MLTSNPKIVVIDDEPVVRQYLDLALTDMGCEVEVFGGLQEGLERCATVDFDVAFVDKNLADGNGLDLCRQLADQDCKVALITGYANLSSAVEAMRLGAAEYFVKPLDIDDLEARLHRMMSSLQLERENESLLAQLKQKCQALEEVATRDPLTGLLNHSHFVESLRSEVSRSRPGDRLSLALIALDRFSEVNERIGTQPADDILRHFGRLLSGRANGGDSPPQSSRIQKLQLCGRLGGDTFSVLMPRCSRSETASAMQRLRERVAREVPNGEGLSLSIGIAEYPEDGADAECLLRATAGALESAKSAGGDSILCYRDDDPKRQAAAAREVQLARALSRSLANASFRFVYQPIVDTKTWQPLAYEALCRPADEDFRHVGEVLEAAARTGRIEELGIVLRALAAEPIEQLPPDQLLFINIHPQDLNSPKLGGEGSPLHPIASRVVLEITETEALPDFDQAHHQVKRLQQMGYRVAIDDFGAGYAGFNSLALLEPDFVKLDMAIVRGIRAGTRAARLTRHVREFCEAEGMQVIAEGVETVEEFSVLSDIGIRYLQGYLLARPAPPFCVLNRVQRPSQCA